MIGRIGNHMALVATLTLLAAGTALAATPINETRALSPDGRLEIDNLKGLIEVRAWDRPEVSIRGSLGEGVEKLEISGDRDNLSIRVKYPRRGSGRGFMSGTDRSEPTELRLMVPLRASLNIDSVSADVDVSGVASGSLSINSVSGDVVVAAAPSRAEIDSVSGDVRLTLNSRKVSVESVSGDVSLKGRLDGEVSAESVSGDVVVGTNGGQLRRFTGSTVSGDMRIETALARGGRISLQTVSGDLDLHMPAALSTNVRGESFSGDLSAPGARINRPRHGPGSSFEHRYGSGDGDIEMETFSGDARLRLK
ncbi:MAG: DUF4097 family beta strand repeat protein [Lysobacter sp.]|nr:DUF4097 family beta strand repeat protein [Lysobacter sp.]MDQ3269438.1 DUF4097 domain-containing protein [Pseudomonadota bacterium]